MIGLLAKVPSTGGMPELVLVIVFSFILIITISIPVIYLVKGIIKELDKKKLSKKVDEYEKRRN
jgi:hypothetical protein